MKKKSISFFRIDERVFITMAIISVISVIVLGFRFKNAEPCQPIEIKYSSSDYYVGSTIQFESTAKNGKKYVWDFGDNSKHEIGIYSITHVFKKAGKYTLYLTVNNNCLAIQTIYIKDRPIVIPKLLPPKFICPDTILLGQPVTFKDITPDAISWQWQLEGNGTINSTLKEPTYIYKTPGDKTVSLRVNGRADMVMTRKIYVKDTEEKKPEPPIVTFRRPKPHIADTPKSSPLSQENDSTKYKEPELKAPEISSDQISTALEDVVEGKKTANDFSEYLCGDLKMPVVYNGDPKSFTEMCAKLREFKKRNKIKTPRVVLTKDSTTRCIKTMNVIVKRKFINQISNF